jgi:cysteinyl-tRNA synthetase
MSWKHLGEIFDIHGGGIDLVFPHHENEIAQTCSAFGHDVMANFWMHNGHLQVEGEKMSKSLGNFVTIHELLHTNKFGGRSWPGEVLRLALLRTHYRQPIDFTVKALEEAEKTLQRWRTYALMSKEAAKIDNDTPFLEAVRDDFNLPKAIAEMHRSTNVGFFADYSFVGEGFLADDGSIDKSSAELRGELQLLGLSNVLAPEWNERRVDSSKTASIEKLITLRLAARAAKNWKESDRIRDDLASIGIALKDNKDGTTTWEVKR